MSARDVIKGRMEHVRRGEDRRGPAREAAGRRKKWVPRTERQIRGAINKLKLTEPVKDVLVEIGVECNGALKGVIADNERMRTALERLLGLGDLCTTCDAKSVREFALRGLGRNQ